MNTRVAVPLSQEAYDAITLLAEVGKTSRGRILADAVAAALPSLQRMADAYRLALSVEGEERAEIVRAFEVAEKKLLDALTSSEGSLLAELGRSDVAGARAPARVPVAADPPLLTGGFRMGVKGGQHEV